MVSLLAIVFPFLLMTWLVSHFKTSWKVFWIGLIVCIIASLLHSLALLGISSFWKIDNLPLSLTGIFIVFTILTSVLSALSMESMRWVGFKWAGNLGRPYGAALSLAAGACAPGMITTGLAPFLTWGFFALVTHLGSIQLPIVNYTLTLASSTSVQPPQLPFWVTLLGSLQDAVLILVPMSMHIVLSVMIWIVVWQLKRTWFVVALLWHALVYGVFVFFSGRFGYAPWAVPSLPHSTSEKAIATIILLMINVVFVVLSYRLPGNQPQLTERVDQDHPQQQGA